MTPAQVDRVLTEIRRACHGYADWSIREIEILAAQNGTSPSDEKLAMREQWDRVLEDADFRSVSIVVRMLEAGRLPWPRFGELLAYLRRESKHVATELARAARRRLLPTPEEIAPSGSLEAALAGAGHADMAADIRRRANQLAEPAPAPKRRKRAKR
ncbi:MAG: hypothetical protein AB7U73_08260 [Pirellulales bacterium]